MKRLFILSIALLLAACSNSAGSEQIAGPTPTLRIVMQATDPSTFEIASGRPQLVDFFAFW